MFFLGSTGTILPYIISLIVIWSGLLLGYGRIFTSKSHSQPDKEIIVETKTEKYSENSFFIVLENRNEQNITESNKVIDSENNHPKILIWYCYLHSYHRFDEVPVDIPAIDVSPTRGPPVC